MGVGESRIKAQKLGRNDPCHCGSGRKYKQCCMQLASTDVGPEHLSVRKILQAAMGHHQAGRLAEAQALYRQILQLQPDHPDALHYLGVMAYQAGRYEIAVEHINQAIGANPSNPEFHVSLGNALMELGQLDNAAASYRKALSWQPDFSVAHNNLGLVLWNQRKLDDAVASFRKALSFGNDAEAHNNLGNALMEQGKLGEAAASYRNALSLKPNDAQTHCNFGTVLQEQGKLDEAVASYRKALSLRPDFAMAYSNLGHAFQEQGKLDEAVASYRKALSFNPEYAEAHRNLGNALQEQGKLGEAAASYCKALSFKPDFAEAYNNLLFLHGYHSSLSSEDYLALACGWERACLSAQDRQMARSRVIRRPPLGGRRLRVGYVSGDYRQHAVSYFAEQLFAHHDRARIELFAYSNHPRRDNITARLEALAEHWVPVTGVSDTAVRERIEADGIDVLIDLSGHTGHNRLGVFARRAAPVQAHYLGFFASTGLTEMDYWIGDEILTPPETDDHFREQVWRLPRVWVSYEGKTNAPFPERRSAEGGAVWVGSFNDVKKLTPATLALWAKVLQALPDARLLLKTKQIADAGNRQRILDTAAGHGIPPSRIELQDNGVTPSWPAHMAYYNRLDIALDPVSAVGGGTTTCDALWMAVPVVTLIGDRMASRMTASMLKALNRPEWIARSEAEYIDKVVTLARDVGYRKELRRTLRSQMAQSPLCDAQGLALGLENAYFDMFERRIDGKNERNRTTS